MNEFMIKVTGDEAIEAARKIGEVQGQIEMLQDSVDELKELLRAAIDKNAKVYTLSNKGKRKNSAPAQSEYFL